MYHAGEKGELAQDFLYFFLFALTGRLYQEYSC